MSVTEPPARTDLRDRPWVREVLNQAPDYRPLNVFTQDTALGEAVEREGAAWDVGTLTELGELAGAEETWEHSWRAEQNEPVLVTHDRVGNRVDEVDLDPSWFWLLDKAIEYGMHSLPWTEARPGAHVARAARFNMWNQVNAGVMCPVSMTLSVVPALRGGAPDIAEVWAPTLTSTDPANVTIAGMAMTERQGGSDVRANTTRAEPLGDGTYELWGHKWFCSYPPCDIFLVLAQAPGGLSCFMVERGPGMEFQRLKSKLGSRSLPSSEVEFRGIRAHLVGEEGRGVPTIIAMVNHTRMDCTIGVTSGLRAGTAMAIHHTRHRSAFGKKLVDQPAMANVLADLALESEASTTSTMRLARAYDEADTTFSRLATAVMKYWTCKRGAAHAAEALECMGGNGYVEDSGFPLLYRDIPLSGIWEGSGNVMVLDVLRAMGREPESVPAFFAECNLARGANDTLDAHLDDVQHRVARIAGEQDFEAAQFGARRLVEDMATGLQASLLVRHAPEAVSDAFVASRLGGGGHEYGTLPTGTDTTTIIDRAFPA